MATNNHVTHDLWEIVETSLGFNDTDMSRTRPYTGKEHTFTGVRGSTELKGITIRDLRDVFIRAIFESAYEQSPELYEEAIKGPEGKICSNDLYTLDFNRIDPTAIFQNFACGIEQLMGIYPNVGTLKDKE
jgi:hypothetical protein